jgi:hypothetical protein
MQLLWTQTLVPPGRCVLNHSLILPERTRPLILRIALVDFNHLAGPFVKNKKHRLTVFIRLARKSNTSMATSVKTMK